MISEKESRCIAPLARHAAPPTDASNKTFHVKSRDETAGSLMFCWSDTQGVVEKFETISQMIGLVRFFGVWLEALHSVQLKGVYLPTKSRQRSSIWPKKEHKGEKEYLYVYTIIIESIDLFVSITCRFVVIEVISGGKESES